VYVQGLGSVYASYLNKVVELLLYDSIVFRVLLKFDLNLDRTNKTIYSVS